MDLLTFDSHVLSQQAASPPIHQPTSLLHSSSSHTGFPIIAVAIIGILATALLLVGYYIFVIKCCLNWHRIDLLRHFSLSRSRRRVQDPSALHSPVPENRGLDELVIRSIPIFKFKKNEKESSQELKSHECAVCLNEFQEEEKLRAIPNCAHVFHIDCIDIWLQNNSNCPLCRTSVSATRPVFGLDRILDPTPFPQDLNPSSVSFTGRDEDYVLIEIVAERETAQLLSTSPLQRKSTPMKETKKVKRVSSMGDECIDIREKDWRFAVEPIRRSFSMDSAADRQLYLAVQDIQEQSRIASHYLSVQSEDYCSGSNSSRLRRSFFSFGQARGSRTAVQPVSE